MNIEQGNMPKWSSKRKAMYLSHHDACVLSCKLRTRVRNARVQVSWLVLSPVANPFASVGRCTSPIAASRSESGDAGRSAVSEASRGPSSMGLKAL